MVTVFVLIHGGLHGGWCWEQVIPLLEEAGYGAIAPNLPGMSGEATPLNQVTLATYSEFVADLVSRQSEPVVLVGHSMGGITISEAAERVPERIAGLVFVTANLSGGGMSMTEFGGTELEGAAARGVIVSADGLSSTYDPAIALEVFYNTTDEATAQKAVARLTPQPLAPVLEPLTVTEARFGRVPRAYVECLRDNAIPIALQRRMQAELPCDPVYSLDTDHSPFLCAPGELANYLINIPERFERIADR